MTDEVKLVVLEAGQGRERMWALHRLVSVSGAEVNGGEKWRQTALGHRGRGGLGDTGTLKHTVGALV